MFGTLKLIDVVGHAFAAPLCPYIIDIGALDLKVLNYILLFKSHSLTIPSPRPVARNSLCLLNFTPPETGICLLWYALKVCNF